MGTLETDREAGPLPSGGIPGGVEMAKNAAFERWHDGVYEEWWKDHKRELWLAWEALESRDVPADVIVEAFSTVVTAIKDQYGD